MNIDEQFVAYALQKGVCKLSGEEMHFIHFKSKLWNHTATITKFEFDSIFEKVCIKKEEPKETTVTISITWKIINAIKGQTP